MWKQIYTVILPQLYFRKAVKSQHFFFLCVLKCRVTWYSTNFRNKTPFLWETLLISFNTVFLLFYHSFKCSENFRQIYHSNSLYLNLLIYLIFKIMYSECYAIINKWYSMKVFSPFLYQNSFDQIICIRPHSLIYLLMSVLMKI